MATHGPGLLVVSATRVAVSGVEINAYPKKQGPAEAGPTLRICLRTLRLTTIPCEAPRDEPDMGGEQPGLGGGDGFLPILGQSAAASEPGEGAFDNPAARQDLEALGGIGTFDNLHRPLADLFQGAMQFRPPMRRRQRYGAARERRDKST